MDGGKRFSLIVVGAGHAGLEAAFAGAQMGESVALVSLALEDAGEMPCNPSIGGIAKGHLVKEIDALGGMMGLAADHAGIQFRMLNRSKGPAVWGPRAQADKIEYSNYFIDKIEDSDIEFIEGEASEIIIKNDRAEGIVLTSGENVYAERVIITTGTFLRGLLHTGLESSPGGRLGAPPSNELSLSIKRLGFEMSRLKTGTPARIFKDSIDFSVTEEQPGDKEYFRFSFRSKDPIRNDISCHITHTNARTHGIINAGLKYSPLYAGKIEGIGPRYCPSIEDKLVKFPERQTHQIFLEPEGLKSDLVYPNGISTSLPPDVQLEFIHTIKGLEKAEISRWGYAVEYDVIQPTQLKKTLETKKIAGLYFAGQVNGTSGYEEAAAQGLMAGINAVLSIKGKDPFILDRSEAYIGVLIEDLVLKGVNEPYRLFTSQAEHRLLLRQDTALLRLYKYSKKYSLMNEAELKMAQSYVDELERIKKSLKEKTDAGKPGWTYKDLAKASPERAIKEFMGKHSDTREDALFTAVYDCKYQGYIEREIKRIESKKYLRLKIPAEIDYYSIKALKNEAKEKLQKMRPETLEDALKIPGISASDIDIILTIIRLGDYK